MVEKVSGYRTRGGQHIVDEESALIAETMEEIISAVPELALIAPKIQANLARIILAGQELAAFYGRKPPLSIEETTLDPAARQARDSVLVNIASVMGKTYNEVSEDFSRMFDETVGAPEGVICDCSALMNGDSNHSPTCSTSIARRVRARIDEEEKQSEWPCTVNHAKDGTRCPVCQDWPEDIHTRLTIRDEMVALGAPAKDWLHSRGWINMRAFMEGADIADFIAWDRFRNPEIAPRWRRTVADDDEVPPVDYV